MNKNEIITLINTQKGIEVLTKKNTHFSNIVQYRNKIGWWFNIPFSKFKSNLYLLLSNGERFILIEILSNSILNPGAIFRKKDENKLDIFIEKNESGILVDKQSSGSNYVFNDYHKIILSDRVKEELELDVLEYNEYMEYFTNKSKKDSEKNRIERLKISSKYANKLKTTVTQFRRNTDVIVEVLNRANGICEKCKCSAPFIRKKDNTPYLEVHHIIRLANNGEDTIENAIAICPNCHRELHYG